MSPLRYAQVIVLGGLLTLLGFFYLEAHHYQGQLEALRAGQAAYEKIHLGQLAEAKVNREQEDKDNADYRAKHPMGAVFLCKQRPSQSSPTASPGPSSSSGMGEQVSKGDSGGGSERAGPDIGPLQDALGTLCDKVTGELREQQGVE